MIIKFERSGGLAGISKSNEFDTAELSLPLKRLAKKLIESKNSRDLLPKCKPRGAADHYTYKISIEDGKNKRTIVCDEYQLQGDLKSLIKQLEKISKNQ